MVDFPLLCLFLRGYVQFHHYDNWEHKHHTTHIYIYIVTVYIYIYIHITIRWLGNSFCLMVFWMDLLHGVPTHTSVTCSMSRLHPAPNPPKMYELDSGTSTICVISSQDLTRTSVHHISFTYIYIYISICIYVCIYIDISIDI